MGQSLGQRRRVERPIAGFLLSILACFLLAPLGALFLYAALAESISLSGEPDNDSTRTVTLVLIGVALLASCGLVIRAFARDQFRAAITLASGHSSAGLVLRRSCSEVAE